MRSAGSVLSPVPILLVSAGVYSSVSPVTVGFCQCEHEVKFIDERKSWKPQSLDISLSLRKTVYFMSKNCGPGGCTYLQRWQNLAGDSLMLQWPL